MAREDAMAEKGTGLEPGAVEATTLSGAVAAAGRYLRWQGSERVVVPPEDPIELGVLHAALRTIFAMCESVPATMITAPFSAIVTTVIMKLKDGEVAPDGVPVAVEFRIPGPLDAFRAYAARVLWSA